MSCLEELGLEEHGIQICLENVHVETKQNQHAVVVPENLSSVACPQILSDVFGAFTDAIDKPLRVVVQRGL